MINLKCPVACDLQADDCCEDCPSNSDIYDKKDKHYQECEEVTENLTKDKNKI